MRIALAQCDFPVGAVAENAQRMRELAVRARDEWRAQLVVFPELSLSGYLAEDLFLRADFIARCQDTLDALVPQIAGIDAIIGHPMRADGRTHNALTWVRDGRVLARYCKQALPNYTVFDEKRYFTPGSQPLVVALDRWRVAPIICEDLWEEEPARLAMQAGADVIISINASPYGLSNRRNRFDTVRRRAQQHRVPIAYVNVVGGQDELVFDGASVAANPDGQLVGPAASFEDRMLVLDLQADRTWEAVNWASDAATEVATIYQALVRALRDFVHKNGFERVLLGLSGGVDSALTLALAADALGSANVTAVMMPSPYTSQLSLDLASEQARLLQVPYQVLPMQESMRALLRALEPLGAPPAAYDTSEENLQSRIRGLLLMALSNRWRHMLLSTGNKSELAVGYATLYGDLCGGFAPLKDVYKTQVYALCAYRNSLSPTILPAIIDRPPTAELKPNQRDQDSLPPYEVLDAILHRFVEQDLSVERIAQDGFARDTVERVVAMVLRSEFKRQQAAPGPRINQRAFGRDRRYPISSAWQPG